MFTVTLSLTFTFTFGRAVFSKLGISAVTEYTPGGTERNRYDPVVSVVVWNVNPLSWSVSTTFGRGTTAPVESLSTPVTVPKYP